MSEIKYAGFTVRFIASLLDTFILALPLGILVYTLSGGEWFNLTHYQQNIQMALAANPDALNNQPKPSLKWELIFELLVLLVTLLFWKQFKGATPGKKLLHIKIVDAENLNEISSKQALTRSLGYIPSTFLLGLGFLIIIFTKKKQSLHDKLANTVVIYT